ncbi:MAG: hypothetical protein ACI9BN_001401, partial [Francisella sp.]
SRVCHFFDVLTSMLYLKDNSLVVNSDDWIIALICWFVVALLW